ncbi:unnamed protein product [Sphenostylis stenocarpa]|uniref:Uncharacterized protein n=1 Tax=Sphenostylis stenocarpa TaxID=92480 RepID=A0AA86SMN1_9FABA|nr:unnamed protein product [Sphenostylis stenocarpa]
MILSVLSSLALVSGLMVARAKNPVHSIFFPIPVFRDTSGSSPTKPTTPFSSPDTRRQSKSPPLLNRPWHIDKCHYCYADHQAVRLSQAIFSIYTPVENIYTLMRAYHQIPAPPGLSSNKEETLIDESIYYRYRQQARAFNSIREFYLRGQQKGEILSSAADGEAILTQLLMAEPHLLLAALLAILYTFYNKEESE